MNLIIHGLFSCNKGLRERSGEIDRDISANLKMHLENLDETTYVLGATIRFEGLGSTSSTLIQGSQEAIALAHLFEHLFINGKSHGGILLLSFPTVKCPLVAEATGNAKSDAKFCECPKAKRLPFALRANQNTLTRCK